MTKPVVVNTAPTVAISNVTNGASYEFGNVPVARCNVTDKEDGNSSFDASLSAITGARAAEGLGSQTASCNYDDAGGLNAKASATYSIVDTSKPLVTVDAPASTEATGALTPVTFAASAYDAVDGNRPVTCKTAGGTDVRLRRLVPGGHHHADLLGHRQGRQHRHQRPVQRGRHRHHRSRRHHPGQHRGGERRRHRDLRQRHRHRPG